MAYNFAGAWVACKHKELGLDDDSIQELKSAVKDLRIDYIITGGWSQKAAAEAERLFGPEHNYAAIFFGAQKNLGMAGITVAVIHKKFLPQPSATLMRQLGLPIPPRIFEFETIAKNNSLYNTLSIFDVYIAGQVLRKLLLQHPDKVQGQQAISEQKAQLIYKTLEEYTDVYHVIPDKTVRSRMNICFRITGGEEEFLKQGTALGLTGLRGHRDLKGVRVSNSNSVTFEGTAKLANFIGTFASQGGDERCVA
ncbi:pyridoxal phosphate-dependent transferase [Stachybotrys elegans]|uniref:phosphoserine transaminase n=1 Tax=Stachybotrys elegans TaxID=80388 RepID=A0A8K0SQF2_9HYPO|nr:pyridoxal phosphate-dependent transferase [Stachybotrys elegans]